MKIHLIKSNNKGFTLVELIVSMVIVAIIITVITSYFLASNRISILEQDQRDAQSVVRMAMDSILKETRYSTVVEVVDASTAESQSKNAIYLKGDKIVIKENGVVVRELNGQFSTLSFQASGNSLDVDLSSTYRGQTYPLQSTFQFPNLHLSKSSVIGSNGTGISFSAIVTGVVSTPGPNPVITRTPSENPTTATSISFTVTFDQDVIGFGDEVGDVNVSGGSIGTITGSGKVYTFQMNGILDGLVTVVIPAGACTNEAGIANKAKSVSFTKGTAGIPAIIVSLTPSITSWTNQDITAQATGLYCTVAAPTSFTFTSNGDHTFTAIDEGNNPVATTVSITNIDKVPPANPVTSSHSMGNNAYIEITSVTDNLSGLSAAPVYYDSDDYGPSEWQALNYVYHYKKNQTVTIKVRDNAGNIYQFTQ